MCQVSGDARSSRRARARGLVRSCGGSGVDGAGRGRTATGSRVRAGGPRGRTAGRAGGADRGDLGQRSRAVGPALFGPVVALRFGAASRRGQRSGEQRDGAEDQEDGRPALWWSWKAWARPPFGLWAGGLRHRLVFVTENPGRSFAASALVLLFRQQAPGLAVAAVKAQPFVVLNAREFRLVYTNSHGFPGAPSALLAAQARPRRVHGVDGRFWHSVGIPEGSLISFSEHHRRQGQPTDS